MNAKLVLPFSAVFGIGQASRAEVIEHDVDGAIETVGTRLKADGNATQRCGTTT